MVRIQENPAVLAKKCVCNFLLRSLTVAQLQKKAGASLRPLLVVKGSNYSTAFTMSSMTFFASPNTIMVLSM